MAVNFSKSWGDPYAKGCYTLRMSEIWKPAPGYEGFYEVSSEGNVRSVERQIRKTTGKVNTYRGRDIKTRLRTGYPSFVAATGADKKDVTVHRLVCEAFHGPAPEGKPLACHANGVKTDNRSENLYWGSYQDNQLDTIKHGKNPRVNRTNCPQGHPYNEVNTKVKRNGHRECRECNRVRARRNYRRSAHGSVV